MLSQIKIDISDLIVVGEGERLEDSLVGEGVAWLLIDADVLAELQAGAVRVGVEENLAHGVQPEPVLLAEEDRVVAVTDRDHVVLPGGVVGTALGLELELHGEAEPLLHHHVVLTAAGWLGEWTGEKTSSPVYGYQGNVDRRLLTASTALEYNCQPAHTK